EVVQEALVRRSANEKFPLNSMARYELSQFLDPPDTIINSIGMKLVPIPPGEFFMGRRAADVDDPDINPAEERLHRVRITSPFHMGMFAVTQAEYVTVMGENPSVFHGKT